MNNQYKYLKLSEFLVVGIALSLLTTVAGINIFALLLLFLSIWGWLNKDRVKIDDVRVAVLFVLIFLLCIVDVWSNLHADHSLLDALKIMMGDLRTFLFVILMWPIFSIANVSRRLFWTLVSVVAFLSFADLISVIAFGNVGRQMYVLEGSGPNMNGQILVGLFFVLAQLLLTAPKHPWRIYIPMALMIAGLFFASERRTGWFLLLVGGCLWVLINKEKFMNRKAKILFFAIGLAVVVLMLASSVVHNRLALIWREVPLFIDQSPEQRILNDTSIGIRLQFDFSAWQLHKESGLFGVGSLDFRDAFWRINGAVEGLQSRYSNPHNEYLYMLVTKGWIGLVLYVAIFAQACFVAIGKTDEVQRKGMLVLIFLFMLSITTNSMMIDMKEGHFAMLMMLVFLAPRELNLLGEENHS